MATYAHKKNQIRSQILDAAQIYSTHLAGRVFLYVVGSECFEVVFQTNRFMHLTGVLSSLTAQDFYKKARKAELASDQFFFNKDHSMQSARHKLSCLKMLPNLTNGLVCIVKDLKTLTLTYKIGVTNLDFTLGLMENLDDDGDKINDWWRPRTLRINDNAIENSADAQFVDWIFAKDASHAKYETIMYTGKSRLSSEIENMLTEKLKQQMCALAN